MPNDGNFCLNGLLAPDRTPHPALWELAKLGEPFQVEAVDLEGGYVRVRNRRHTLGTDGVALAWAIEVDGLPVQEGIEVLPSLPPGETASVQLPLELHKLPEVGERWLTVRFVGCEQHVPGTGERRHSPDVPGTAPARRVLAWAQFPLPAGAPHSNEAAPAWHVPGTFGRPPDILSPSGEHGSVPRTSAGPLLRFRHGPAEITFDPATGRLAAYTVAGRALLAEGPVLNLWRAPTDNDEGLWGVDKMAIQWRDAGLDRLESTVHGVEIVPDVDAPAQIRVEETWQPRRAGAPARSGWWDFLLLMLRMHLFQFWTPAALDGLAGELGLAAGLDLAVGLPAGAGRSKYDFVQALVAAADAQGKTAALLAAAHAALQAGASPDAPRSFERRLGQFLHQDARQLAATYTLEFAGGFDCTTTYAFGPHGSIELALDRAAVRPAAAAAACGRAAGAAAGL